MEHLRYPEDLFKAQRYQFQRYHVTDAADWFEGSAAGRCPRTRSVSSTLQPPYRLFADTGAGETWSLTSVYVPRGKETTSRPTWPSTATRHERRLRQDLGARAAQRDARTGPARSPTSSPPTRTCSSALLPYTTGDAKRVPGNLLTLPVGDGFMYVQPVYTRRKAGSTSRSCASCWSSYNGNVGIGTTLRAAIEDSLPGRHVHHLIPRPPSPPRRPAPPRASRRRPRRRRPRRVARRPRSVTCSARRRPSSPRPTRHSRPATR